jgi:hypothetical protein
MNPRITFLPVTALANLALIVWWYFRTNDYLYIIGVIILINLALAWWLDHSRRDWWSFALLPIIFPLSSLAYALIISNTSIVLLLAIFTYLVIMVYWRLVFVYVFKHALYRPFSLERLFYFISFIAIFFFSGAAYGLKTFLDIPTWQIVSIFLVFQTVLTYQWFWVNKIDLSVAWPYSIALLFMILELFFVIILLPLNFNLGGFIVASSWHGLSFLAAENIGGRLTPKRSRLIIGLIVIIWLAVLATARWF